MGSEGIFRKIFGRKGLGEDAGSPSGPALHPAMAAELQRLDLYRPGLGRAAIQHVASGEREDVVATIAALIKATPNYQDKYTDSIPLNAAHGDTNAALIRGEIAPGPELARLLTIRGTARRSNSFYDKPKTGVELVLAQFTEMVSFGLSRNSVDHKVTWDTVIPVKTLFAHVRAIGGTMVDLFKLVLTRNDSLSLTEGSWSASADFAAYATTYPAALGEALCRVPQNYRSTAIKLIEHHRATAAPEIEAAFVAMLAKPFDKSDREIATSALARLDAAQLLALLRRELPQADIDTRLGLVQAAGRNGSPEILALLAERPTEKAAKVKAAIEAVLEAGAVEQAPVAGAEPGAAGYAAIDGSFVELPPRKNLGSDRILPPTDEACVGFVALMETVEARRVKQFADYAEKYSSSRPRVYEPYPPALVEAAFATLTEGAPRTHEKTFELVGTIRFHEDSQAWLLGVLDRLSPGAALKVLRATGFDDVGGLLGLSGNYRKDQQFGTGLLEAWLRDGHMDLRDLAQEPQFRSILHKQIWGRSDASTFAELRELPGEAVWPWVFENLAVLDEAFGLKAGQTPIPLPRALGALELLPKLPQRYFAKVLDIAVAEKRPLRRQAMALLRDAQDLAARIEALLDDKRQQVRINAAEWLADIRATASEKALRKRLGKEKADPVRAALIESLQRLGADLTDVIGPATLIAEAEAACAKAAPELPGWLVANGLPAPHFRDGSTVPPLVVQHWLALAIRLKDPGASGQFGVILDQLDPADARQLSGWVLDGWIAYDTQVSSRDDATAYALANYQNHMTWMCRSTKTPELRERAIADLIREKTGEVLNSGSDTKGMLALACRADPVFAANRVRWFLKKHGRRSNQAMALLEVLAGIGQPAALQVVIAASARLKQKSTQARAAEIAERYAEDRGWSFDELADRTVPTAGFDDDGVLELPCGEDAKVYTARLDAALAIHLANPEGKPVKGLPAGDDEASKEAKKAFSAAKKELAQVIELQGARLFEAMCVERAWPVADWRLAFHEHPVMRRLVERLVWQGLDDDGAPLALFRPTQEGDFTGADDRTVDIDTFAKVRLAHGALGDEATCKAWAAHLKDYEIKPFLAQFDTVRAPLTTALSEAETIDDRQGWKSQSLTMRGVAEKRGYQRVMGDGGGCNEYEKKFASHGITATIHHTGSHAQDENLPLALKELRFEKRGHRGVVRLKDVPPVMLAECWADYHAIAAKGAFDPEWEKVCPW